MREGMSKRAVSSEWIRELRREIPTFLTDYCSSIETIVEIGCWGSDEPFALLWTLDASEVLVIEKEESHLMVSMENIPYFVARFPGCLDGRQVKPVIGDIGDYIPDLHSGYFDLAYCENVLYNFLFDSLNYEGLRFAIGQMARAIKPGGLLVAIEPKLGAKFEDAPDPLGLGFMVQTRVSDPIDFSELFIEKSLTKVQLQEMPFWVYCYRKPNSSENELC